MPNVVLFMMLVLAIGMFVYEILRGNMQDELDQSSILYIHTALKELCSNAGNSEMYDKLCAVFDAKELKKLFDIIVVEVIEQRANASEIAHNNNLEIRYLSSNI